MIAGKTIGREGSGRSGRRMQRKIVVALTKYRGTVLRVAEPFPRLKCLSQAGGVNAARSAPTTSDSVAPFSTYVTAPASSALARTESPAP